MSSTLHCGGFLISGAVTDCPSFAKSLPISEVFSLYRPIQNKLERKDQTKQLYSATHIYRMLIMTILPVILAVRIGEGLDFDSANALTVRKETVMTSEDLLDEEETQQEIVDMLK